LTEGHTIDVLADYAVALRAQTGRVASASPLLAPMLAAETHRRGNQSARTSRPMSLASVSRLRSATLRLNGDQMARTELVPAHPRTERKQRRMVAAAT